MKNKTFFLNTLLTAVLAAVFLVAVIVRAYAPAVIIPSLNIPNMVLISLTALLADHYLAPGATRCYICIPLFSAVSFGLLPYAACLVSAQDALKLGVIGGIGFTATTWLFSSVQERLSTGPSAKAAPAASAFVLYLAGQALTGIFL